MSVFNGWFLDWVPVTVAHPSGGHIRFSGCCERQELEELRLSWPQLRSCIYAVRDDGIFLFAIVVDGVDTPLLTQIRNARIVSSFLKSRKFRHQHFFDIATEKSNPYHNPVLLSANEAFSEMKVGNDAEGCVSAADLESFVKDDKNILDLVSADKLGDSTGKPAILVLRSFHSKVRDILLEDIKQFENRFSSPKFFIDFFAIVFIFSAVAFIGTALFFTRILDFELSDASKRASVVVVSTMIVVSVYWLIFKIYKKHRFCMWNYVGYITSCGVYSDLVSNLVSSGINTRVHEKFSFGADPLKWTHASILSIVERDRDRLNFFAISLGTMISVVAAAVGVAIVVF
jgi:hypothetical protein